MRSLLAISLLLLAPAALRAQGAKTIARYGFVDGAVAIDVRPGGIIAIAGAQGDSAATITFRVADVHAWTDSTRRFVTRPSPKKATMVVLQRSMMEGAEGNGEAVSFLRRAASDTTTFELLFSTRNFGKFSLALERREGALFFGAMQRAVLVVQPQPKKRPAKVKKP